MQDFYVRPFGRWVDVTSDHVGRAIRFSFVRVYVDSLVPYQFRNMYFTIFFNRLYVLQRNRDANDCAMAVNEHGARAICIRRGLASHGISEDRFGT